MSILARNYLICFFFNYTFCHGVKSVVFFFVCFVLFSQRQMTVCLLALCHNAEPFIVSNEKVNCSPFATANIDRRWLESQFDCFHQFFDFDVGLGCKTTTIFSGVCSPIRWNIDWNAFDLLRSRNEIIIGFVCFSIEFKHLNREIGRENVCASKS